MNPLDRDRPMYFIRSNGSGERTPDAYAQVLSQFGVTTQERYLPANGQTYCSTFVWDASRALGCEIPHWWGRAGQAGIDVGAIKMLKANDMEDWLASTDGRDFGWLECMSFDQAKAQASLGRPTVVTYKDPEGTGHIAFLLPSGGIVQAGSHNGFDIPIARGFGNLPVRYFSHP